MGWKHILTGTLRPPVKQRRPPDCPDCGGERREKVKSSELVWPLFILGLLGLLAYGAGLVLILIAGVIEAVTRRRWWICPACDTAEPAPQRASDL